MKFVAISDTHGFHADLSLPEGDVLVHAGDVSMRGREAEIIPFLEWFSEQDFQYKIFIAGNHDFYFEKNSSEKIKSVIPKNIIYLNDSGITIDKINIWGSPVQPWFFDWAFNRRRGNDIRNHWNLIPANTTLLLTHGPAYGLHDKTKAGEKVGCEDLLETIQAIKPRVHVCGHIHEAYGQTEKKETLFINASVLNEKYQLRNKPVEFELS